MPVVGITGGIATGKTLFGGRLAGLMPEMRVFDTDRCARELTEEDAEVIGAIRREFGPEVFDPEGNLERGRLRSIVFGDAGRRKALEGILHPAIRRRWVGLAEEARAAGSWLAVDIPLLYETGVQSFFDTIIVVACTGRTQRRRLLEGRRVEPALAEQMIAAQWPLPEKIDRADIAIWNEGTPEALESQARLAAMRLSIP